MQHPRPAATPTRPADTVRLYESAHRRGPPQPRDTRARCAIRGAKALVHRGLTILPGNSYTPDLTGWLKKKAWVLNGPKPA